MPIDLRVVDDRCEFPIRPDKPSSSSSSAQSKTEQKIRSGRSRASGNGDCAATAPPSTGRATEVFP
jgi:hypothetical protein